MASRSTAQTAYRGFQLTDRFIAHLKPLITATERKPKEGTIPWAVYSAFLRIHFEPKRVADIALQTGQHSLAGFLASNINLKVVSVANKMVAAPV
jgi:hypothetical protein